MERFLSPGWFDLLPAGDDRAGGDRAGGDGMGADRMGNDQAGSDPAGEAELVLEQQVLGAPDGDVRYQVTVAGGRASISRATGAGADMTFTSDYGTATAIAAGRVSVETAMAEGRVRVSGNLARLQRAGTGLAGVDPLAAVRDETSFDAEGGANEDGHG